MKTSLELLAPAGDTQKLYYALAYGADAVYAGVPKFSLRVRENDFSQQSLAQAIAFTHQQGKKIYLTLNIYAHNRKLNAIKQNLYWIQKNKPDGLIISDPALIHLAARICPDIPLHLSTQANAVNWLSVKFWKNAGIQRVILPRELSVFEISEIRQHVPDIELECFVHGSICIAYSGRCLISNYLTHRDPNQGSCANSCRWEYRIYRDQSVFVEEENRPGELMPMHEDEHGTYLMNAKDLCALETLPKLAECGIDSFKIEGRTKSIYYVSVITRAYRRAIDALRKGKEIPESSLRDVYSVANRGYIRGFSDHTTQTNFIHMHGHQSESNDFRFCGIVLGHHDNGLSRISVRNRFQTGDMLEMISPDGDDEFIVSDMRSIKGQQIETAHGGAEDILIELPDPVPEYALLRKRLK